MLTKRTILSKTTSLLLLISILSMSRSAGIVEAYSPMKNVTEQNYTVNVQSRLARNLLSSTQNMIHQFPAKIKQENNLIKKFRWLGAERFGGFEGSVEDIAIDSNNNRILVGTVRGNADLNGDDDTNDLAENATGYSSGDGYITVFDEYMNHQWSKRIGGQGMDESIHSVSTGSDNSVVVVGTIEGPADLDGNGIVDPFYPETSSALYDKGDVFISVFSFDGTYKWSTRLGGSGWDAGLGVTVNNNDDIILTGYIGGNADLNSDQDTNDMNEIQLPPYGKQDIVLASYSHDGTFQWATRIGGASTHDTGNNVVTDDEENIYIVGTIYGDVDLDNDNSINDTHPETQQFPYGFADGLVAKYTPGGTFIWAHRIGGEQRSGIQGIALDKKNNIVVTGSAIGNADLNGDQDTLDTYESSETEMPDIILSVFSADGTARWHKRLKNTGLDDWGDRGLSVAVNKRNGSIYVTGDIEGGSDLNADLIQNPAGPESGIDYTGSDAFITSFNSRGTHIGMIRIGNTALTEHSRESGKAVIVDNKGRIILGGFLQYEADLNGDKDMLDNHENLTEASAYISWYTHRKIRPHLHDSHLRN